MKRLLLIVFLVTMAHGALYFTVTPDSHLVVLNSARDTLWKSINSVPYDSAVVAAMAWNAHQLEGRDTTDFDNAKLLQGLDTTAIFAHTPAADSTWLFGTFTDSVQSGKFVGPLTGNVTGNITGNAATADSSKGGATRATLAANATQLGGHDSAYYARLNGAAAYTAQYYATEVSDSCSGGAATIAFATGNVHRVKLNSGANTLTLTGGAAGGRYLLLLKQPSSGAAGTVTFSPIPLWPSATAPTLSTTNNYLDIVTLAYSGIEAKYLGAAALDLR